MQFTKPITDIIKQRISVRTYTQQLLEPDKEVGLKALLAAHPAGPFQTKLRFELVTAKPGDTETLKGLGTYGQIKHLAGFIIGAMPAGTKTPEDFGYALQELILHATDLGLGTCWLAGSFQQSRFAQKIGAQADETVPAAVSVGYPAEKPSFRDNLVRWIAKPRQRLPWEQLFFQPTFATPLTQAQAGTYATPLEMLRIAPSASNKQPWRVVKVADRNIFHFYVQRTPSYTKSARSGKVADWQRIDLGIAMCHFELTARELGLTGKWQVADPGLTSLPEYTEYIVSWAGAN